MPQALLIGGKRREEPRSPAREEPRSPAILIFYLLKFKLFLLYLCQASKPAFRSHCARPT